MGEIAPSKSKVQFEEDKPELSLKAPSSKKKTLQEFALEKIDPLDPYGLNQFKSQPKVKNSALSNMFYGQAAYNDEELKSKKSKHKSGKSKKSKKRADDILADLGFGDDGKKDKKKKRERVLDDRDNLDFMNEREVSLGKSKHKK